VKRAGEQRVGVFPGVKPASTCDGDTAATGKWRCANSATPPGLPLQSASKLIEGRLAPRSAAAVRTGNCGAGRGPQLPGLARYLGSNCNAAELMQ
jgi:hypothetical protein